VLSGCQLPTGFFDLSKNSTRTSVIGFPRSWQSAAVNMAYVHASFSFVTVSASALGGSNFPRRNLSAFDAVSRVCSSSPPRPE